MGKVFGTILKEYIPEKVELKLPKLKVDKTKIKLPKLSEGVKI